MVVPGGESVNFFENTGKCNSRAFECFDTEYPLDSLLVRRLAIEPRGSLKGSKEGGPYPCF